MPANFPTSNPALATNKADATTTATDHKDHHNQLGFEVNAIGARVIKNAPRNVMWPEYGALVDGSTNDTTAVQAAIDVVAAAGGGDVFIPHGTCRANIVAKPKVRIIGESARGTVLKSVAGSNADVIKGLNFATLTGKNKATGDYALGAYEVEITDLTIDGDKANNSAGWGIRLWGRSPRFKGVVSVRNCKSGGIWNEFTEIDGNFSDPNQTLVGYADEVLITACDGDGWVHRGPHDFVVQTCEIYNCTGWAVKVESSLITINPPFDYDGHNGGVAFRHLNFYLCANGAYFDGSNFEMHGGAITGDTGTGFESTARSGAAKIRGVIIAGHTIGVLLRGSSHTVHAQCDRMLTDAVKLDGCLNCHIDIYGAGNNNVINNVSESGPNVIRGMFDVPSGKTMTTGAAFNSGGQYWMRGYGGGNFYKQYFPSPILQHTGNWNPVLPQSNGTMLTDQHAILTLPVQASNAVNTQLFRDNVTEKLSYKDNAGVITSLESRGLKLPVRVAATTNTTVASPGTTIDGVTMAAADRVLLANQTTTAENGVYAWVSAAAPMTRATDADTALKLTDSLLVTVDEGTTNKDSIWTLSTNKPITVGTTALRFTRIHPAAVAVSQPAGIYFAPGAAKLENMPRAQTDFPNQALLTTQIVRVFPLGALRAGDTLAALNFVVGTTASASITNSWAGIARLSDRSVLAVSATSTATTAANTLKTFTFTSAFTADRDELLVGFVMYQATTVPSLFGINHGNAVIISATPIMNGTSNTGATTPVAVAATLTAFTADTEIPYCYAT